MACNNNFYTVESQLTHTSVIDISEKKTKLYPKRLRRMTACNGNYQTVDISLYLTVALIPHLSISEGNKFEVYLTTWISPCKIQWPFMWCEYTRKFEG